MSQVSPGLGESVRQLRGGLRSFSATTHPREVASILAYGLPRHGLTPASAILATALTWGNATALTDDRGNVTYRQLGAATGRLAATLAHAGLVRPGARVGLILGDDRFLLIALGAVGLCGGTASLINPRLGRDALAAYCDRIDLLISCEERACERADLPVPSISAHELARLVRDTPLAAPVPRHAKSSRFVMLTSGTTRSPDSIPIRRRWSAVFPALALAGMTGVRHGVPTLVCAPLFHGYGLACAMLGLVAGSPVVLSSACRAEGLSALGKTSRASRIEWGEAIFSVVAREGVGTVFAVPAQLRSLAAYLDRADPARAPTERVQAVVSGSDRLDEPTIRVLTHRWGPVVTNYYGTTESGTATMISGAELQAKPTSLGRPVAATRIRIVDGHGARLPRGETGLIEVESPLASVGRSRGWRGRFLTSDLGWMDADGHLYLAGRADEKQRVGGEFVSLAGVESLLAGVEGVWRARAWLVPDERMGQRVAAEVAVSDPGVTEDGLREMVRTRLGPFAVPVSIAVLR